MHILSFLSLSL